MRIKMERGWNRGLEMVVEVMCLTLDNIIVRRKDTQGDFILIGKIRLSTLTGYLDLADHLGLIDNLCWR